MSTTNFQLLANFIWSVADLLRGPYRPPQYERVMLPLTVLRRFDAVLAPTKEQVLMRYESLQGKEPQLIDRILNEVAKDENGMPLGFHNHSKLDFYKLKADPDNIGRHLAGYINGFSENIRKIFERFDFEKEIEKLEEANRLYQVVAQFAEIDLHPRQVDNITMGLVFEDLIRRFNESANETAGDHFTPREVIRLMVNLLLEPDTHVLTQEGIIATICDPACGTGGMLAEAQNWIRAHNDHATVKVYGQDYNPRSYAVAASDLLIKGHKDSSVALGNTLTVDPFPAQRFDYLLANPPFGVDWQAEKKIIDRWPNFCGYKGKAEHRQGKIQLIDARDRWTPMKRSLGNKRRYLDQKAIDEVTGEHGALSESKTGKIFDNADFGYRRVAILRPLRLRFQITQDTKERYLDVCPELHDALTTVEAKLGRDAYDDWNSVWEKVQNIFKAMPDDTEGWSKGAKGTAQKKLFRDAFTIVDPDAKPVIAKLHKAETPDIAALFPGQSLPELQSNELHALLGQYDAGKGKFYEYEADPALKDFENIPLKEDLISYVKREVLPYVGDAWIDREALDEQDGGIGKVGYEINFNREFFFQYQPPRPLHEIDAELEAVEKRIMGLLREVTE